jgi:hypothetical protein
MSIASLGIAGSLAGTSLPQRAAETDKTQRERADQDRAVDAAEQAENAAGIGETEEDSQTSERDADGRRLWEQPTPAQAKTPDAEPQPIASPLSKDPTGSRGSQLDLLG